MIGREVFGADPSQWLRERLPIDAGRIARHPFVRVGRGSRPLVIVPGLNDPLTRVTDSPLFAVAAASYCVRYVGVEWESESRPVYMVSRPAGHTLETTRELAVGYATVLDEIATEHDACIDLLGLSMGGFVVSAVAREYPDLVRRLVFGLAASRLSGDGRKTVVRWGRWADQERWLPIYREAIDAVSLGHKRRALQVAARGYHVLTDGPRSPRTFHAEARACLAHDGRIELKRIEAPTLVIGADADPFFSTGDYRETASLLPNGSFRLFSAVGHEAVLERRRAFDAVVKAHLAGDR